MNEKINKLKSFIPATNSLTKLSNIKRKNKVFKNMVKQKIRSTKPILYFFNFKVKLTLGKHLS